MDELSHKLQGILEKVQGLSDRYEQLQTEAERLRKEKADQELELNKRNKNIAELEEKIKTLQIAKSVDLDEDKTVLKQKINAYIKEIDRCIALLND